MFQLTENTLYVLDTFQTRLKHGGPGNIHPSWTQLRTKVYTAYKPILTVGCLGPVLLALMGMELGPFREVLGDLLPLVTMDGLLREEVGVVAVWVFVMKRKKHKIKNKITKEWLHCDSGLFRLITTWLQVFISSFLFKTLPKQLLRLQRHHRKYVTKQKKKSKWRP